MAAVAIIGGGHNGLTAAAYLARAGVTVTLFERLNHVGGAAISAQAFDGIDARLSRYSYLVSLLPEQIIRDLSLDVSLVRRRYSSYTPVPGTATGLLIDAADAEATRASFAAVGAADDADGFASFYRRTARLAASLFPTMTERLPLRTDVARASGRDSAFAEIADAPIGEAIEAAVSHDLVRGVIATDALIGTYASMHDASLEQNRCLLYHVIGGGTGDWDVPVGGMGQVSGGLERAARAAGATIVTGATVTKVTPDGELAWSVGDQTRSCGFDLVLSAVAPHVLASLVGVSAPRPEGAQVKVNMLLRRLPKLRGGVSPEAAFGGTFHINESYSQLEGAYRAAGAGQLPSPLPCEIYCHSLSDPSILSPELAASGAHTLTVFGLHVPDRLLTASNNERMRAELQAGVLASLNSVLAEPIDDVLLDGPAGPCIETKTTRDIEAALAMPGGNIFHGSLSWPWLEAPASTVAEAWGVETEHERILMAGSGARRGGAVSGVGGHNAAHAALELLGLAR